MEVRADVELFQALNECIRHDRRLERAEMDARATRARGDGFERVDKRFAVFEILAPRGDLDAGDDDLLIALRGE